MIHICENSVFIILAGLSGDGLSECRSSSSRGAGSGGGGSLG